LIRSIYGRAFVHVCATLSIEALMREERRGWGSASSVVVVGCLDLNVS
jgi:hypothetical protein